MQNETVEILLSSYNGEKYIAKQLDSILAQTYPNIQILIRDDGSTDRTLKIINQYRNKYSNIQLYVGENIGACNSFLDLMENANIENSYFAFADQDDYWLNDKIEKAVLKLQYAAINGPVLYSCNVILVDENLKAFLQKTTKKYPSFGNSLIENICAGCTCVFNRKLMQIFREQKPKKIFMHDWWIYQLASAYGSVIHDEQSYILYRQHQSNVIGAAHSKIAIWKKRLINYKKNEKEKQKQLLEVKQQFVLYGENQRLLDLMISSHKQIHSKIEIIRNPNLYRQSKLDTLVYKLLLVFRRD